MSNPRNVHCYAYVNRPYDSVRTALHGRPRELLKQATMSASARASSVAASLRVGVGGIDVAVAIKIHIDSVRDLEGVAGLSPVTSVRLGWEAASGTALFPLMSAELTAWPLTSSETQLEIEGVYRPPLGAVGNALDAAVGHRIAEASVHRFLDDVVEQLRRDLPDPIVEHRARTENRV